MPRINELRLMTKVARMYYDNNISQSGIAERLDLSQATISRLLTHAKHEHIIRFVINPPTGTYSELEEILQKRFKLKDVIVADCSRDEDELILREIGSASAYYLENTVKKNEIIGISSWSASLLAMLDAMHPLPRPIGAQVLQMQGGVGVPEVEKHANHLATRLASYLKGSTKFLPAPGVVGSVEAAQVMLADAYVRQAIEEFDHISLAMVGIGGLEPSRLLASSGNIFSPQEINLLRMNHAVGDICLRFFDANGQPVETSLNERVIGIHLHQLRRVKRCVGVAGGKRKRNAIAGALKGGLINVLITDRFTAEWLVKEVNPDIHSSL
jgi:DNA-binding transcriptional regulator LsrR (DeoR family)